jgi:CBS domain-containing protein
MTENRVRHIPIFEGKELKGLVSIGDIVKSLMKAKDVENKYLKDYIADKYPG